MQDKQLHKNHAKIHKTYYMTRQKGEVSLRTCLNFVTFSPVF